MSEIMRPISFGQLISWAMTEYRQEGRVFGLPKEKFFLYPGGAQHSFAGFKAASPLGPAAGPHTQLAQNILTAYLAGGRIMELKTVQQLDGPELSAAIARPCIRAEDEGYNVEWSTELTVEQAFGEYAKAWLAIHVLGREFGLCQEADCVFNLSVGYDLAGIKSAKIDGFIENMKDASSSKVFQEGLSWLKEHLSLFEHFSAEDLAAISPFISNSVTLSTLHGCPPQEIERIAKYLMAEKGLHTYVKCNPTLLGYAEARRLLDALGYEYLSFDNHHFDNDLQYEDAVAMLGRLLDFGGKLGLCFGVKLTNTFPVKICRGELPGEEMYLSGRALYPLSVKVAARLAGDFKGQLPISYCGGADAFNIADLYRAGLQPLTVATTLLKPGGYGRLFQLAGLLAGETRTMGQGPDAKALAALADGVLTDRRYHKESPGRGKTAEPLPLTDCFKAPCEQGGCPLNQQIPAYLAAIAEGDLAGAFRIIIIDNALPAITGAICNHPCQGKCTRRYYEQPLQIREAKRLAAQGAQQDYLRQLSPAPLRTAKKALVVGAGPAGVALAFFLRRNGVAVTVLEQRERPLGMVEYLIPDFRIGAEALRQDFALAQKAGAEFHFGVKQPLDLAALRAQNDFVVLALGAWRESAPVLKEGQELVLDALAFLETAKAKPADLNLGKRVAVLGGGDVAMDCARVALRMDGVEQVTIVYRRSREFMPAQHDEIELALREGAALVELAAPISFDGETMLCERMRLGDWDETGRRGIIGTGEQLSLGFDSVISATGARINSEIFAEQGLELDQRGRARLNDALESSLANVYVAGDCKAGPATVAEAIADAKRVAGDILAKLGLEPDFLRIEQAAKGTDPREGRGYLSPARTGAAEAARCLNCGQLCEICVEVCPNRANLAIELPEKAGIQILHLDAFCNECGNCSVFCPYQGEPYQDKLTLFAGAEDFADSRNRGFLPLGTGLYRLRLADGSLCDCSLEDEKMPTEYRALIKGLAERYAYCQS